MAEKNNYYNTNGDSPGQMDEKNKYTMDHGPIIDRTTGRIEFTDSYTEYMEKFRKDPKHSGLYEEEE